MSAACSGGGQALGQSAPAIGEPQPIARRDAAAAAHQLQRDALRLARRQRLGIGVGAPVREVEDAAGDQARAAVRGDGLQPRGEQRDRAIGGHGHVQHRVADDGQRLVQRRRVPGQRRRVVRAHVGAAAARRAADAPPRARHADPGRPVPDRRVRGGGRRVGEVAVVAEVQDARARLGGRPGAPGPPATGDALGVRLARRAVADERDQRRLLVHAVALVLQPAREPARELLAVVEARRRPAAVRARVAPRPDDRPPRGAAVAPAARGTRRGSRPASRRSTAPAPRSMPSPRTASRAASSRRAAGGAATRRATAASPRAAGARAPRTPRPPPCAVRAAAASPPASPTATPRSRRSAASRRRSARRWSSGRATSGSARWPPGAAAGASRAARR